MLETILAPVLLIFGAYFTFKLKFYKPHTLIRLAAYGIKPEKTKKGEISSLAGMFTALAGTIGTGNIVGVVGAIMFGGAGAIFWMWGKRFLFVCDEIFRGFLSSKVQKAQLRAIRTNGVY
jgi:AGCS family alanine or glycine:cation symporter